MKLSLALLSIITTIFIANISYAADQAKDVPTVDTATKNAPTSDTTAREIPEVNVAKKQEGQSEPTQNPTQAPTQSTNETQPAATPAEDQQNIEEPSTYHKNTGTKSKDTTKSKTDKKSAEAAPKEEISKETLLKEKQPGDLVFGKDTATVTIVEYASMSCPHCAAFHKETFPLIKAKYIDTGKVRFIFRQYPFDEPALRASILVNCSHDEKLLGAVFESQKDWAPKPDYLAVLKNVAALAGVKDFDGCMENKDIEKEIIESRLLAEKKLAVSSTPSFFINGEKFSGEKNIEFFSREIDRILKTSYK